MLGGCKMCDRKQAMFIERHCLERGILLTPKSLKQLVRFFDNFCQDSELFKKYFEKIEEIPEKKFSNSIGSNKLEKFFYFFESDDKDQVQKMESMIFN